MSLVTLTLSSVVEEKKLPTAVVKVDPEFGLIGSVVKLDGRLSTDPDNNALSYTWSFDSVPIGSAVGLEGFRTVDPDGSVVSFSPDIVGEYVIGLVVSNGVQESPKAQGVTSIRAMLVPHAQGLVPDGKWIWSYIRDIWSEVENKEMFETLWSALIQVVGGELLKLYQVDFNKSIRDIQDLYQRRWISYEPELEILVNGPDFYFGNHYAGTGASSVNLGLSGVLIILGPSEVMIIEGSVLPKVIGETLQIAGSRNSSNDGSYALTGLNLPKTGYRIDSADPFPAPNADKVGSDIGFTFDFQSVNWSIYNIVGKPYAELMSEYGSPLDYLLPFWMDSNGATLDVQVGDVIHFKGGPNKGFYRIINQSGSFFTVDRAPPSFSDSTTVTTYKADVYRPVRFTVSQAEASLTDTVAIPFDASKDISGIAPGRLLIVNGQAYTIIRAVRSNDIVLVTLDGARLPSGVQNLSWRTPPTLISTTQNFSTDGVTSGDLIVFDVVQDEELVSTFNCQVLGVNDGRLGFVASTEPIIPGEVPEVSTEAILKLASDFGITGISKNPNGSLNYSGQALAYKTSIESNRFKETYWNKRITPDTEIQVNPSFKIKPRIIKRTRLIPVDDTLRSIPMLQNFIVQPTIEVRDGVTYQVVNGKRIEIPFGPMFMKENIDYIIDDELAFDGKMTFRPGSDIVEVDGGDFVDRNIAPGDQFIITAPVTLARTYYVQEVLSSTRIRLSRDIPSYLTEFVTASVQIKRKQNGRFLRFAPGRFSASNPPPSRFWAEVSFFDNSPNIENNFGILVGLKKEDVDAVSSTLNYRQTVAGLMYAYTKGSALEKVRIGAQILLGLPFAENRGVIRSIEPDYRLDINGNPILRRILVEDVDAQGTALGVLRVYTYPIEAGSELAGLEVNPSTNAQYAVGDVVERFAPLSKGVEIRDYITNPNDLANLSPQQILQQYHTSRILVNDNIFTLNEIELVSNFLKRITPSYIAFIVSIFTEHFDSVPVTDFVNFGLSLGTGSVFVDNASFSIPPAVMFDARQPAGSFLVKWGNGFYAVRRAGRDAATVDGSGVLGIASGGVQSPRANESFEAPLTQPGDKVLIYGTSNPGLYTVSSTTNTTITFSDAPAFGFETESDIRYSILRPIDETIRTGTATFTSGNAVASIETGLRRDGVAPGDWLLDLTAGSTVSRYTIAEVFEGSTGLWNRVRLTPTPTVSGSRTYEIVRPSILLNPSNTFSVTSSGANILTATPQRLKALAEIGDELQVQDNALTRVTVLGPEQMYVSPALSAGTYSVKLIKKRKSSLIGFDHLKLFDPIDEVSATLRETQNQASCTASSNIVALSGERTTAPTAGPALLNPINLGMRPGDLLVLSGAGNGAVNIGYGAGVFPISQVEAAQVRVIVNLTATENVAWAVIRRR